MAVGRKLIIWSFVAVIVLFMAVGGFYFSGLHGRKTTDLLQSVPAQSLAMARILDFKDLPAALADKKIILYDLAKIPFTAFLAKSILQVDTLLSGTKGLKELLSKNQLLLAWVPDENRIEILVLFQIRNLLDKQSLTSFFSDHFSVTNGAGRIEGRNISKVERTRPFFFCISDGIFTGSTSTNVIRLSLQQMDKKSPAFSEPEFREIIATSGKNVDANIFLYVRQMEHFLLPGHDSLANSVTGMLGYYASLDMRIKENGIMFNGFLASSPTARGLTPMLKGLDTVTSGCPAVLPSFTTEFLKIGFSDFKTFAQSISLSPPYLELSDKNSREKEISHFLEWTQREVTLARLEGNRHIGVFPTDGQGNALPELKAVTQDRTLRPVMGISVYQLVNSKLIADLLGPLSGWKDMPYYCLLDGYVVFGDSEEALQKVIQYYSSDRTLVKSEKYRSLPGILAEYSNLYYYLDLDRSLKDTTGTFFGSLSEKTITDEGSYRHFPILTGQFSITGNWIYANIALPYEPRIPEEKPYLWRVRIDSGAFQKLNLADGSSEDHAWIFLTDNTNNLYRISSSGEISWKRSLSNPPLGEIRLTFEHGNNPYFMFNTRGQIYKLTADGKDVPGFPTALVQEAATGLTLIKYPDSDDTRIMIGGTDRKIYNYDTNGEPVKGWVKPDLPSTPSGVVQLFSHHEKDYLFFTDDQGHLLITDRRGKRRIKPKGNITFSSNSGFYLNRTNSKGLFLTTDEKGHLMYIDENGKIQETIFGEFSPGHYFYYTDVNGDNSNDFVYFDQLKMIVFDRFKNKLINIQLPEIPSQKPAQIEMDNNQKSFLFKGWDGSVYLIDPGGNIIQHQEISSFLDLAFWNDQKSWMMYLLASKGNEVYLYPVDY